MAHPINRGDEVLPWNWPGLRDLNPYQRIQNRTARKVATRRKPDVRHPLGACPVRAAFRSLELWRPTSKI